LSFLVLDASVAVKWYLPRAEETLVEEAYELLRRSKQGELRFVTPDSFWAEFGNVLWKAVRRRRWSEESAVHALREMRAWNVPTVPAEELLERALSIALETGRTVNDSLYVALAIQARSEMVTADERLVNALGSRFPVRWLGAI
jgi:predicted nucleic acid-binding protein